MFIGIERAIYFWPVNYCAWTQPKQQTKWKGNHLIGFGELTPFAEALAVWFRLICCTRTAISSLTSSVLTSSDPIGQSNVAFLSFQLLEDDTNYKHSRKPPLRENENHSIPDILFFLNQNYNCWNSPRPERTLFDGTVIVFWACRLVQGTCGSVFYPVF